jgi:hypothetical protein
MHIENLSQETQNLVWQIYNSQTYGLTLTQILTLLKSVKIYKADLVSANQTPVLKTGVYFVNAFDKICQIQYNTHYHDFECRGDRSISIFCDFRKIKRELRNLKTLTAMDLPGWEEKMLNL